MEVQLLYFEGCPHWTVMEERLRHALVASGEATTIEHYLVNTQEAADRHQFAGSPSVLLDGQDPFPSETGAFGLTCRVSATPHGSAGAPTVEHWPKPSRKQPRRDQNCPATEFVRGRFAVGKHPSADNTPRPGSEDVGGSRVHDARNGGSTELGPRPRFPAFRLAG